MTTRKTTAILLALLLVLSLAACSPGTPTTSAPASSAPVASAPAASTPAGSAPPAEPADDGEGEWIDGLYHYKEPVHMTALVRYETQYVSDPATETWFFRWIQDAFNIHIEVEGVPQDAAEERSSLIFASNALPDLLFNWPTISMNNQGIYGDREGQLVKISDYMTEEYMPNLLKIIDEKPIIKTSLQTYDGNIYSFPTISQNTEHLINMNFQPLWYDPDTLASVGYDEPPATLDELLTCLRLIKEQDPRGQGANNLPMGGSNATGSLLGGVLWNALGVIEDFQALTALKDGGFDSGGQLIPFRIDERYRTGLEYMHTLYTEGLIDLDFFTLTVPQTVARLSSGHTGLMSFYDVYDIPAEEWQRWRTLPPMTSSVNDKKYAKFGGVGSGGYYCYVPSTNPNPGAVARMLDPAYSPEYKMNYFYGPEVDSGTEMYGMTEGWYYDANRTPQFPEIVSGKFTQINQVTYRATPFAYSGNVWDRRTDGSEFEFYTRETQIGLRALEDRDVLCPYLPYSYKLPPVSMPLDIVDRMNDVSKQLTDYANAERARFITGDRPLTDGEWDAYVASMNELGYQEYMDNYKTNLEAQYSEYFNTVTRPSDF